MRLYVLVKVVTEVVPGSNRGSEVVLVQVVTGIVLVQVVILRIMQ